MARKKKTLEQKILDAYEKGYDIKTIGKRVGASPNYIWGVVSERHKSGTEWQKEMKTTPIIEIDGSRRGHITKRMKLLDFLNKYNVEPTDQHYNIETSWSDYERGHSRVKDKGKLYDKWFKENKDWIKPIIAEVAMRDYGIEVV